jgi:signal transduction histidine kinase
MAPKPNRGDPDESSWPRGLKRAGFGQEDGGIADVSDVERSSATTRTRTRRNPKWRSVFSVVGLAVIIASASFAAAIVMASDTASQEDITGQAIQLTVTLLIPAFVMLGYWLVVRRQVSAATSELEARLDADQDVVAAVSHQLRDQLTVIYGFSESLLDSDLSDQSEVRDIVTVINAEAVDLSRIVDDLVSAAELKAGDFDVKTGNFDPSVEMERVVVPFRRRGREISLDCWSGVAVSDPVRFRQIMRSLLSNAIRHGGSEVAVVGEVSNGWFRCTVADDGEGMATPLVDQLFGPDPCPVEPVIGIEGSGLGLAVSHAIANELGGHLTYERPAEVTMVTVALPTKDWPDAKPSVPPAESLPAVAEDVEEPTEAPTDANESTSKDEWRISFENEEDANQGAAAASARPTS